MDTPGYEPSQHESRTKKDKSPRHPPNRRRWKWILLIVFMILAVATPFAWKAASPWLLEQTTLTMERSLSEWMGNPVRFKAIVPHFQWLRPGVEFQGFEVVSPEAGSATLMQARAIRIQIDLSESLRLRQARFGRVAIEGLRVEAAQGPNGDWDIRGLRRGATGGSSALAVPAWLSPELTLELVDLEVNVRSPKETRTFNLARGQLHGGWSGQIVGSADFSDLRATWPYLYKDTQHWKALSFGWKFTPGVTDSPRSTVKLEDIRLRVKELALAGRTSVSWAAGAEPQIDASLDVEAGDFAAIRALIPNVVIPPSVQSWLARSIRHARIESAHFALAGKPSKFEKLALGMNLKGLELEYLKGWPVLRDASGTFQLDGEKLAFAIEKAEAAGITLTRATGTIDQLGSPSPLLVLGSEASAPEKSLLEFLHEGPLKSQLASLWNELEWKGPAQIAWRWKVPLGNEGAPSGTLEFRDGSIQIKRGAVLAEKLTGTLEVGAESIEARELKAQVLGEPAQFSVVHPLTGKGIRTTKLTAEVPLTSEQILTEFPTLKPWAKWEGRLRASIGLDLDSPPPNTKSESRLTFRVQSTLEGLEVVEPVLAAKDRAAKHWLKLEGEVTHAKLTRLEGRWAHSDESSKPELRWDYDLTGEGELTLNARLAKLDWDPWEDRLKAKKSATTPSASKAPETLRLNVLLDELAARSNVFHAVDLQFTQEGAKWSARLKSQEANGELSASLPLGKSTLDAKFTTLKLAHWPVRASGDGAASPAPTESPSTAEDAPSGEEAQAYADWPSLSLSVEQMELGPEKLGNVRFKTTQTGERIKIEECSVKNTEYELQCEGGKLVYSGDAPTTSFSAQVKIKALDHKLPIESVGALEAPGGKMRFDFTWPGTPSQFEWAFLKGTLAGDIDRGKLKAVKLASAGLLRISNLNFHDDGTLDFRKLSFKLAFDRGSLQFQPLKVFFGTTFIKVQGRVGMASHQIDLTKSVKTNIGRNIGHMLGIESDEEHEASNERDLYATDPVEGLDVKRMKGTWEKPTEE